MIQWNLYGANTDGAGTYSTSEYTVSFLSYEKSTSTAFTGTRESYFSGYSSGGISVSGNVTSTVFSSALTQYTVPIPLTETSSGAFTTISSQSLPSASGQTAATILSTGIDQDSRGSSSQTGSYTQFIPANTVTIQTSTTQSAESQSASTATQSFPYVIYTTGTSLVNSTGTETATTSTVTTSSYTNVTTSLATFSTSVTDVSNYSTALYSFLQLTGIAVLPGSNEIIYSCSETFGVLAVSSDFDSVTSEFTVTLNTTLISGIGMSSSSIQVISSSTGQSTTHVTTSTQAATFQLSDFVNGGLSSTTGTSSFQTTVASVDGVVSYTTTETATGSDFFLTGTTNVVTTSVMTAVLPLGASLIYSFSYTLANTSSFAQSTVTVSSEFVSSGSISEATYSYSTNATTSIQSSSATVATISGNVTVYTAFSNTYQSTTSFVTTDSITYSLEAPPGSGSNSSSSFSSTTFTGGVTFYTAGGTSNLFLSATSTVVGGPPYFSQITQNGTVSEPFPGIGFLINPGSSSTLQSSIGLGSVSMATWDASFVQYDSSQGGLQLVPMQYPVQRTWEDSLSVSNMASWDSDFNISITQASRVNSTSIATASFVTSWNQDGSAFDSYFSAISGDILRLGSGGYGTNPKTICLPDGLYVTETLSSGGSYSSETTILDSGLFTTTISAPQVIRGVAAAYAGLGSDICLVDVPTDYNQ